MSKLRALKHQMGTGILVLITVLLSGCTDNKVADQKKDILKIGVAIYRGDDAFISSLGVSLTSEGNKLEKRLGRKVIISLVDSKNNQGVQNDQIDNFIKKGYDAICVNMVDRTAAAVMADKAKEAGIPLVFFNREPVKEDIQIWDKIFYVGTDAREAGTLEGELLVDVCGQNINGIDKNGDGKLQYVLLEGEQVHQDALVRTEYAMKTITQAGIQMEKLGNETCNWLRSPAYEAMLKWIDIYGDSVEVVLSNNDEMAIGAVQALKERGMMEDAPVIVGIDGVKDCLELIKKGDIYGTVKNDAQKQAEVILNISVACAEGKVPEGLIPDLKEHYIRIPHYKVTAENVESVLEKK